MYLLHEFGIPFCRTKVAGKICANKSVVCVTTIEALLLRRNNCSDEYLMSKDITL